MELQDKQYPYPVLTSRTDDYVGCSFDVQGTSVKHEHELELQLNTELNCQGLNSLVERGDAAVILHVECSRSAYRRSYVLPIGEAVIRISSADVSGRVTLCPFVVAQHEIKEYRSDQFNPIYQDLVFCIRCGAVLAEGEEKSVYVDTATKDIDYKPDIFSVVPDAAMNDDAVEKSQIKIDALKKKITIQMPTRAFRQYGALLKSGISNEVVLSAIVLPAMMEALYRMRDAYKEDEVEDLENLVWFNVVKERIEQLYPEARQNIMQFVVEKMNVASVAQTLIKSPVVDALHKLSNSEAVTGGD